MNHSNVSLKKYNHQYKTCIKHTSEGLTQCFADVEAVNVKVIAQKEVIVNHGYTGFALIYKVADDDQKLVKCRNFYPNFYAELMVQIGTIMTPRGTPFRVVSLDRAVSFVDKEMAFQLHFSITIKTTDKTKIARALKTLWSSITGGKDTIPPLRILSQLNINVVEFLF